MLTTLLLSLSSLSSLMSLMSLIVKKLVVAKKLLKFQHSLRQQWGRSILLQEYTDHRLYLFEDVQRMNLFRQVEIHCVGVGEASKGFLEALAGNGLGRVRMIGKSMGKPPEEKN